MRARSAGGVVVVTAVAAAAWAGEGDPADPGWRVARVAGPAEARVEAAGEGWRSGACAVTTPLPEGYPAPTAPGALELKRYPAVRRAEVSGRGALERGMNGAFFPLFWHIKRAGIAMTAPVEVDVQPDLGDAAPEGWTMAFLYRTPDLGPVGPAAGEVTVVDRAPVTVLAIGLSGADRPAQLREAEARLTEWLAGQTRWERAGAPRVLYYNGPEVPRARRWFEVQLPVRAAPASAEPRTPRWF